MQLHAARRTVGDRVTAAGTASTPGAPLVHVVDDDASVRTALLRLLHRAGYEARAYATAIEFLVAEKEDVPCCLLLDLRLPGMSGAELQAALNREAVRVPIVFLTGHADVESGVAAMKSGAVDFLTKPVKRDALLEAVSAAIDRASRERVRDDELRSLRARFAGLTPREREVLSLVTDGRLNKQIAEHLGTSLRTVKAHRARVMGKLGVASVAELVRAADRLRSAHDVRHEPAEAGSTRAADAHDATASEGAPD